MTVLTKKNHHQKFIPGIFLCNYNESVVSLMFLSDIKPVPGYILDSLLKNYKLPINYKFILGRKSQSLHCVYALLDHP